MSYTTTAALLAILVAVAAARTQDKFKCSHEGRYADTADCGSYYTCTSAGARGGLEVAHGSCNGFAFHPQERACVSIDRVPGCKPTRKSRHYEYELDHSVCEEDTFMCGDCKSVINCVNQQAFFSESCAEGFTCQTPESFFGAAACYPKEQDASTCKCNSSSSFTVDPYTQQNGFIYCPEVDSDPIIHRCPEDLIFIDETTGCISNNGNPLCTKLGTFANPENCENYYTCIQTAKGWVQNPFTCDEGKMFNEEMKECSDPCEWPTPNFTCLGEGRFADPRDCRNYNTCVMNPVNRTEYLLSTRACPLDYVWDPSTKNGKGHCVHPSQYPSCKPVEMSKCNLTRCDAENTTIETEAGASSSEATTVTTTILPANSSEATTTEAAVTETEVESTSTEAIAERDNAPNTRFAFRPQNSKGKMESLKNVLQSLKNNLQ